MAKAAVDTRQQHQAGSARCHITPRDVLGRGDAAQCTAVRRRWAGAAQQGKAAPAWVDRAVHGAARGRLHLAVHLAQGWAAPSIRDPVSIARPAWWPRTPAGLGLGTSGPHREGSAACLACALQVGWGRPLKASQGPGSGPGKPGERWRNKAAGWHPRRRRWVSPAALKAWVWSSDPIASSWAPGKPSTAALLFPPPPALAGAARAAEPSGKCSVDAATHL